MSKKSNISFLNHPSAALAFLSLAERVQQLEDSYRDACEMAARTILQALDVRDNYTYLHSARVAFLSLLLGKEISLTSEELYNLELASVFHDIGKIGVPDRILLKTSQLTDEEFNIMRSHPEKSAEILSKFSQFQEIAIITKHHHERFDGRGYPYNLQGEDIPLFSRIILISDTFDAMTSSRTYRGGLPNETAMEELLKYAGSQFDPYLVNKFVEAFYKDQKEQNTLFHLHIVKGDFKKRNAA